LSPRLRLFLLIAFGAGAAVLAPLTLWGAVAGIQSFADGGRYVSTSRASVTGDLVAIGSISSGRVADVRVMPGASVRRGDVLADVELPAAVRTTRGGTPVLAFLGSRDQEVEVTAPIDGMIAAVPASAGTAVSAGQILVRMVDPAQLWVTAYVDESDISRVRVGQAAEVYLAVTNRSVPGVVQAIVPATTAAVSSTPPASVDASNRGTQLYPVHIRIELEQNPQLLGSSAEVRIRAS
jgi:multidrug resistance efflux pump